jgi:uncharacterized protein YceK
MSKPVLIAFLALVATVSGCGTMANMHDASGSMPPRPFGGLATDFEAIEKGDALGIIDLPASLVFDVVTLPEVLYANQVEQRRQAAPSAGDRRSQTPPAEPAAN